MIDYPTKKDAGIYECQVFEQFFALRWLINRFLLIFPLSVFIDLIFYGFRTEKMEHQSDLNDAKNESFHSIKCRR